MKNYFKYRRARINFEKLRELMHDYWKTLPQQKYSLGQISYRDSKESLEIRKQILALLPNVSGAAQHFGINYTVTSYPAPAVGGPIATVSLYDSIINPQLGHKVIEKPMIEDAVEKSIAIAKGFEKDSLIHWLCPWNWIIDGCALIIRIPFIILRRAGLPDKVEENIIAHVIKIIFFIVLMTYLTYKGITLEKMDLTKIIKL